MTLTSEIAPKRPHWLWESRVPLGELSLFAGPEGVGKSTLTYQVVSDITRGKLPGEMFGTPRMVFVVATEDAWAETIVPRLIAAGADRRLVACIEIEVGDMIVGLDLRLDLGDIEALAQEHNPALLLLDPLMSRLGGQLDSHKDAEVRLALEPLVAVAHRCRFAVIGIIHLNKGAATAILDRIMGSKAFTAVARSVSVVIADPEDDTHERRLFGTPKNNLGRSVYESLAFTIESVKVETDDGDADVGRIVWGEASTLSIQDAINADLTADPSALGEALMWLGDYMSQIGEHGADKADVIKAATKAGISNRTLDRAKVRLGVPHQSKGFPRTTTWYPPATAAAPSSRGDRSTA